jgi:U3 small nucleolar RNA-associated protein 19
VRHEETERLGGLASFDILAFSTKMSILGTEKRAKTSKSKRKRADVQHIVQLEAALEAAPTDLNPLADLIGALDAAQSPRVIHAAAYALHRIFSRLIRQGRLHGRLKSGDEAVKTVREWLKARWTEYTDALCRLLAHSDGTIRVSSTTRDFFIGSCVCLTYWEQKLSVHSILLDFVRVEAERLTSLQNPPAHQFASHLFRKIVRALLIPVEETGAVTAADVRADFVLRYLNFCDDVRYYFLRESAYVLWCSPF